MAAGAVDAPVRWLPEELGFVRRSVNAGGYRISYVVGGSGDPVLLIHGIGSDAAVWRATIPVLAEHFTVYAVDLLGCGLSEKPKVAYTAGLLARTLGAFTEALGLTSLRVVGHSLGGGIALLVHLRDREAGGNAVGRLILIDCAAYPQRLPRIMRWLKRPLLGWSILHLLPLGFMVRFTLEHVFHDPAAITPERMARYAGCFSRRGVDRAFIATCRQLDPDRYGEVAAAYCTIAIPTLVIWGREDRIIRFTLGERLAAAIPGARMVMIDRCGHNPHEEKAAETFAAIGEFLKG